MSYPHRRESLLTQLESMHKQLNDETRKKSGQSDSKDDNRRLSGPFSRPERKSMPMFTGSSSHTGVLAANNTQDMTFVMGLSENLLVECRRLQAENEMKTRKLKATKQDYEEMQDTHQKLSNTHQVAAKELQTLRDANWELEGKLKSVSVELKTLREKSNKNSRKLKQETESANQFKTDLEVAELKLVNLETQLDSANHQHAMQAAELRKHISELNDENDALHLKNKELCDELRNIKEDQRGFWTLRDEANEVDQALSEPAESNDGLCNADLSAEQLKKVERMTTALETVGLTVLLKTKYMDAMGKSESYDNPSIEYLEAKANELGKQLVSNEELHQLREIPLSTKINDLENKGYRVLENAAYEEILGQLETPSLDFLRAKLELHNCAAIAKKELSRLQEPDLVDVIDDAKKLGYTVVANDLHSQAQKNLTNPSLEFLKEIVQKGDTESIFHWLADERRVVFLEREEFIKLNSCFTTPTREYLEEKASLLGYGLIKRERIDELVTVSETPDIKFLSNKAESLGFCLIERTKLATLTETSQSPKLALPSLKADKQSYKIADSSTCNELIEQSTQPDLRQLQQKASTIGYHLIDESLPEELKRRVSKPNLNELSDIASDLGFVTVSKSEYEETKALISRPPSNFLYEKAQEQGLTLIATFELQKLKNNTKDRAKIISAVKSFGFVPIPVPELEAMKSSSLAAASLSDLKKRLQDLGYMAISQMEYKRNQGASLLPNSREDVIALCSSHDLVALPRVEHETLKKETKKDEITVEEHVSTLKSHGYVVLVRSAYDDLQSQVSSPSIEFLSSNAKKLGYVTISSDEHRKNLNMIDMPSIDYLRKKVSAAGFAIMKQEELDELQSVRNSPSLEYLASKAKLVGRLLVEPIDIESRDTQIKFPSIDYLSAKAQESGRCLVSQNDLKEMEQRVECPSNEELERLASKRELVLVPEKDYLEMKNRLDNLTLQELHAKALQLSCILVPISEYDHLQHEYNNPSEAYLDQKALIYDKLLLGRSIFETLKQQSTNPSERFLAEHAAALGKVLIPQAEYEKKLVMFNTPSRELLEKNATDAGLALVDAGAIESFQTSTKLINLVEKAGFKLTGTANGELLFKRLKISAEKKAEKGDEYEPDAEAETIPQIIKKSLDFESSVENCSFVLITKEDYQSLLDACIKRITKREVINICPRFNLVPLPSEKYDDLTKEPSLDHIRSLAEHHASVVVMREQLDMLKAQVESPSWDAIQRSADQKGMVIVNKNEYESMTAKYHSPTKIEVERQAEKLDMIAIPTENYERLLRQLQNKSSSATPSPSSKVLASKQYFEQVIRNQNKQSDKLYEPTKSLGFVTLSGEEYRKLKGNQKSYNFTKTDIYNGAKAFSLAVLPIEEYKALLRRKPIGGDSLEYEDLQEFAAKFDMKLVPFHLDSPTPCRRKSMAADPGESLKFHDQFSIATSDSFFSAKDGILDDGNSQIRDTVLQRQATVLATTESLPVIDVPDGNIQIDALGESASPVASLAGRSANESHEKVEEIRARATALGYGLVALSSLEPNADCGQQAVPELSLVSSTRDEIDSDEPSDLDEQTLMREAEKKDLVLLPRAEYENYLTATSTPITREKLEVEASKLDLVILTKEEYDELLEKGEFDACRIEELAPQFGLNAVKEDYLLQLKTQLANERLTANNVKVRVADLGYVALTASEFENLHTKANTEAPKITREVIEAEASHLGLIVIPKTPKKERSEQVLLVSNSSNSEIENNSKSFPVSAPGTPKVSEADQKEVNEMPNNSNVEDIVRWASEFKLVPIAMEQFEQIKEELSNPTLTNAEIIEQARKHDMIAIPKSEYEQLSKLAITSSKEQQGKDLSAGEDQNAHDGWDKNCTYKTALAHLKVIADRFKLFRSPEGTSEDYTLNGAGRLVILSDLYYKVLLEKQKAPAIKIAEEKIRMKDERLAAIKVKNQHLLQPPIMSDSKMDRQASRGSLKSPLKSTAPSSPTGALKAPRSVSHSAAFTFKHSRSPSLVTRNDNSSIARSGSMGAISLATVASLSEPSIIPALTQTVIGEYLHKYYPYLGSFGLHARHERFFWVHPYTLTLYWSTTNPVLSNPSSHRTKCAAIISVESVVDTNPYPAGLYHKSIIVHSENKKVKITCATRQRHNIWYNSLRYLIQRSMEGINLEDIADDPSDTMYSGKIFPLQGENSKSASQRLSSSRRSVKSRMRKSTSVPIKNK